GVSPKAGSGWAVPTDFKLTVPIRSALTVLSAKADLVASASPVAVNDPSLRPGVGVPLDPSTSELSTTEPALTDPTFPATSMAESLMAPRTRIEPRAFAPAVTPAPLMVRSALKLPGMVGVGGGWGFAPNVARPARRGGDRPAPNRVGRRPPQRGFRHRPVSPVPASPGRDPDRRSLEGGRRGAEQADIGPATDVPDPE